MSNPASSSNNVLACSHCHVVPFTVHDGGIWIAADRPGCFTLEQLKKRVLKRRLKTIRGKRDLRIMGEVTELANGRVNADSRCSRFTWLWKSTMVIPKWFIPTSMTIPSL